jgi:hypothetical protein
MRQKFRNVIERDAFLPGGYLEKSRFIPCFDIGFEALASHFDATPYHHIVEAARAICRKKNHF